MQYTLMHKNISVANCRIEYGRIVEINTIINKEHAPIGTYDKNGIIRKKLIDWFDRRSIPASRDGIKEVLNKIGIHTSSELIEKSYGLSLSDQYWIKPEDKNIRWEDINFFDHDFSDDIGSILLGDKAIDSGNLNLHSPDNTSDGWLKKKWKIIDNQRILVKAGSEPFYQEPLNEIIATELCKRLNIPHVSYKLQYSKTGMPYSLCQDYVNRDTELVTAYAMSSLLKQPGSESDYAHYVRVCKIFGIEDIELRLSQMICVDFLMANTDRHWTNFGTVRDANTLEFIEAFPIYDTGTSLWNNKLDFLIGKETVYGKMFQTPLTYHLRYIKDDSFIDFSKLKDFPEFASEVFHSSKFMQDSRIISIENAIKQQIKELDQVLSNGIANKYSKKQSANKAISWSPLSDEINKKKQKVINNLKQIPGLEIQNSGKFLRLSMKNGLDMKYFLETETLQILLDNEYKSLKEFPIDKLLITDYFEQAMKILKICNDNKNDPIPDKDFGNGKGER